MNWTKIKEKYPKASDGLIDWFYEHKKPDDDDVTIKFLLGRNDRFLYDFFDKQMIRISLNYYDKRFTFDITVNEKIQYFDEDYKTRTPAEEQAFEKAFELLEERLSIMCHKCNIEMGEGDALQNTSVMGIPDFEGQTDIIGQTFYYGGTGKLIKVYKCSNCGHSISRGK